MSFLFAALFSVLFVTLVIGPNIAAAQGTGSGPGIGGSDSDRAPVPTAVAVENQVPAAPQKRYVHFLFSGQSLSIGSNGIPALSTVQPYGNKTFTAGPRSQGPELSSLIDLVEVNEQVQGSKFGETTCSGAANYVIELTRSNGSGVSVAESFDMISSTAGMGGYTMKRMLKGMPGYKILLSHMNAGYVLSAAEGRTYSLGAIGWIHGETDQANGTTPGWEYKDDLIRLQAQVDADTKRHTGQTTDVVILCDQISGWVTRGSNFRRITLAQLAAHEESPLVSLVTSTYPFPYHPDGIHFTNVGYLWMGHYFGKAYKQVVVDGRPWTPLRPKRITSHDATSQGTGILVEFHVPEPPLVLDVLSLGEAKAFGFAVEDDAGLHLIRSVKVIGDRFVEIRVDRPLAGNAVLRYGLDWLGKRMFIKQGASGNLRDSEDDTFTFGSVTYNLYNWCVAFEKPIDTR